MIRCHYPARYLTITIALLAVSLPATARIKCWTNHEGVRECGQVVPPEFAQQGHEELTKHGTVKDEVERAPTEEELAEIEARKEQERLEREKQKQQARLDKILMNTFTSVEGIKAARDEKIAALDTTINLTNKRTEKIQEDLDKRIERAAAQERSGKQPSEKLLESINSLKRQIKNNESFIAEKRREQDEIRDSFARDIARFQELKGME
jgi:exonuclease VII large subunit